MSEPNDSDDGVKALPEHPCYCGDSDYDHDYKVIDESFDHEYGCEQIFYSECCQCGHITDLD